MKNIDIDRLSRKMPYKPLDESYFEQLPLDTLAKIGATQSVECNIAPVKRWRLTPQFITATVASLAAVVTVGLFITFDNKQQSTEIDSDEQIDEFVMALSDSDLELLINEAENNYEFYTNL